MLEPILNKIAGVSLQYYWKQTLAQVFFCEFWIILRTPLLKENLRTTLLINERGGEGWKNLNNVKAARFCQL